MATLTQDPAKQTETPAAETVAAAAPSDMSFLDEERDLSEEDSILDGLTGKSNQSVGETQETPVEEPPSEAPAEEGPPEEAPAKEPPKEVVEETVTVPRSWLEKYNELLGAPRDTSAVVQRQTELSPPAPAPTVAVQGQPAKLDKQAYFELLDDPEKFETFMSHHRAETTREVLQSLPQISLRTMAEQLPFAQSSYSIMKACPEYRKYPNVVLQALRDTYDENDDPITWEEKTIAHLNATTAKADTIVKGKGKIVDNRPKTAPPANAPTTARTQRTIPAERPPVDPTRKAFDDILGFIDAQKIDD